MRASLLRCTAMEIVALAGGIGAGKFLRGLVRAAPEAGITAVVNTGDDVVMHGLHVSPDLDSVTYWLGDAFDRERGWGRRDETFRATEELRAFGAPDAWFGLGDLDLATHLFRTPLLAAGVPLSEVTARVAARFGIGAAAGAHDRRPGHHAHLGRGGRHRDRAPLPGVLGGPSGA